MSDRKFGFETLCLHAGQLPDAATASRATPIYQTTSYVFDSTDHAASLFNLQTFGNVYSRMMNPTNAILESAWLPSKGACRSGGGFRDGRSNGGTVKEAGDDLVASRTLYGGTYSHNLITPSEEWASIRSLWTRMIPRTSRAP